MQQKITVEKLPEQIEGGGEVNGFNFKKVYEDDISYIYLVEAENTKHFEAFFKKSTFVCLDFKKRLYSNTESKEVYPRSKDFGLWAWSSSTFPSALKLLEKKKSQKKAVQNV